ncbi:MAG TPA: hypothetical protein V6C46_06340, partial [Coleofasciculaceae cyanobacterium]
MGILQIIGLILGSIAVLVATYLLALEIQYRRRVGNALVMLPGRWELEAYDPNRYLLVGRLELINRTKRLEIMVPELEAEVTLLSGGSLDHVTWTTRVTPRHVDAPARSDGYWFGYIVKTGKQ